MDEQAIYEAAKELAEMTLLRRKTVLTGEHRAKFDLMCQQAVRDNSESDWDSAADIYLNLLLSFPNLSL